MQRTVIARRSGGVLLWKTYELLISVPPPQSVPDHSRFVPPIPCLSIPALTLHSSNYFGFVVCFASW